MGLEEEREQALVGFEERLDRVLEVQAEERRLRSELADYQDRVRGLGLSQSLLAERAAPRMRISVEGARKFLQRLRRG